MNGFERWNTEQRAEIQEKFDKDFPGEERLDFSQNLAAPVLEMYIQAARADGRAKNKIALKLDQGHQLVALIPSIPFAGLTWGLLGQVPLFATNPLALAAAILLAGVVVWAGIMRVMRWM